MDPSWSNQVSAPVFDDLPRSSFSPTYPPQDQMAQQVHYQIGETHSRLEEMRNELAFNNATTSIGQLDSALGNMPAQISELRGRGYIYRRFWEQKVSVLQNQWQQVRGEIINQITQARNNLGQSIFAIEQQLQNLYGFVEYDTGRCQMELGNINGEIENLRMQVYNSASSVQNLFGNLETNILSTQKEVDAVRYLFTLLGAACFRLSPSENPIDAVPGKLLTEGTDKGPLGFLYLTDKRLIFEENENVVTERRFLVMTKTQLVQKVLIDVPIGAVVRSTIDQSGRIFKTKLLLVQLNPQVAQVPQAHFHLEGDVDAWATRIGQAAIGDLDKEKIDNPTSTVGGTVTATAPDAGASPTAPRTITCSNCGATLTSPIVRGMESIKCDYCGTVLRL